MSYEKTHLSTLSAVGWGVLVAVVVTAIMLPLVVGDVLPIDQPFAATFAQSLFGADIPLPVGVGLHLLYVSFWSFLYLLAMRSWPFQNAAALAVGLWVFQAAVFYPIVGWGFLGSAVSTTTGLMTLVPHAIFALALGLAGYILNRYYAQPQLST